MDELERVLRKTNGWGDGELTPGQRRLVEEMREDLAQPVPDPQTHPERWIPFKTLLDMLDKYCEEARRTKP